MKRLLLFLLLTTAAALGQANTREGKVTADSVVISGTGPTATAGLDASQALHTLPVKVGLVAGLPGTCTVGERYFASNGVNVGQQSYTCTATNVWTLDFSGNSIQGTIFANTIQGKDGLPVLGIGGDLLLNGGASTCCGGRGGSVFINGGTGGVGGSINLTASGVQVINLNSPTVLNLVPLFFRETTAPGGAAGNDVCYGDSTAHKIKCALNNGTFDSIVHEIASATLQNKTMNGAGNGNSVNLIDAQGPASAVVGTGADATVYSKTILANTVGANKCFNVDVGWVHSTGTAAVTYKLKAGATTISTAGPDADTTVGSSARYHVCNIAQNSQYYQLVMLLGHAPTTTTPQFGTSAADFSQTQTVSFTFNVAATDQVTPKFWKVTLDQ